MLPLQAQSHSGSWGKIKNNSFAAGNPCKVIRPITEADSMRYKPEILLDNQIIE